MILLHVLRESGSDSAEEINQELTLIDDMLSIQKSKSLLNKKKGFKQAIKGRIALEVAPETVRVGQTNFL